MRRPLLVLLSLVLFLSSALPQSVSAAEVGSCRKANTEREERRAPHIFFTIDTGKKLLLELKGLRQDKKRLVLIETKLKLNKEIEGWYKVQISAAEKTVDRMAKDIVSKRQQLESAKKTIQQKDTKINQLTVEVAKYKGERYQWLVYGVGGTVVVVVLGILAYGVYSAVSVK